MLSLFACRPAIHVVVHSLTLLYRYPYLQFIHIIAARSVVCPCISSSFVSMMFWFPVNIYEFYAGWW